ncbi:ABC transporter ATP-binding protein [Ferruginibacter sp.]|uniref:ABC transporter ATP-binding protein n=1 Tax=Ferruginibacter sp. TaxID=1940288 RepID=UPI0019B87209|nr:ABC transporter ATP-binding protein [Ferruginibacter sp.]MBC7629033.1 ABC transporter ATP-binding protein [Ferruginibacter sp.]
MSIAIQVQDLSKAYQIGQIGTGTISKDLERWWATAVRGKEDPFLKIGETYDRAVKGTSDIVWSLKDINFEIQQGDAVGIIGRNGAGKSTLLKLLSEVTSPTTGKINIKGRVASLLEVGTGFHPELTGRENIFLNGAILGMRKKEIQRKLDQIIDFSGVERYVDTPVKRYSSGMYVRLAFAVAAHLESEILIVDEVLAVGDAEFQKKCLGKMGEVSMSEGRTVLFVSHNMGAVQSLCNSAIILNNGTIYLQGKTSKLITEYLNRNASSVSYYKGAENPDKKIRFQEIRICDENYNPKSEIFHDEHIHIKYTLKFNSSLVEHDYSIFCIVLDKFKNRIFSAESPVISCESMVLSIHPNTLVRGSYTIYTFIHKPNTEQIDVAEDVCRFSVIDNNSWLNIHGDYDYGNVFANVSWING